MRKKLQHLRPCLYSCMSSFWNWFDKEDGGLCCQAEKEEKVEVGDGKRPLASEAGVVRTEEAELRLSDRKLCVRRLLLCRLLLPSLPCPTAGPQAARTNARYVGTSTERGRRSASPFSPVLQNKRKENTQKLENWSEK